MSDHSRAVLYSLTRMMRPKLIAEIGTFQAGTTEVFARALWENGEGTVHSVDPYGGERCPAIIAQWPQELQDRAQFQAKSSMDFFARMVLESKVFELILIDGNHEYEYAMYDLLMAARLLRPGGVIVMDNSEQSGPFRAGRDFLAANPAWREIGGAVEAYDPLRPFDRARASMTDTSFLILQAPEFLAIGPGPHSWGAAWIDVPKVSGLRFDIAQPCKGTLFFQIYLRAFANRNQWVREDCIEGKARLETASVASIDYPFGRTIFVPTPPDYDDTLLSLEMAFSWQADAGGPPLALEKLPVPI